MFILCQSSRDFFERKLCQIYWHKPIFFQKTVGRLRPCLVTWQKDATSSMSLICFHWVWTYLQVLEQWNFLVRNFTLSFWILGPAFDLSWLFILKNINMYMNSTHIVAKVCSVLCGGSLSWCLPCIRKSQYSTNFCAKWLVVFVSGQRLVARQLPTETIDRRLIPKDNGKKQPQITPLKSQQRQKCVKLLFLPWTQFNGVDPH